MYFLSRLLQPLFSLFRMIRAPFSSMLFNMRVFMVNNPLALAMRWTRGLRYRASYYTSLPRFWLGQMRIPSSIRRFIPGLPKGGKSGSDEKTAIELERQFIDPERLGKVLPKRAQFSQIHLVNINTGQRHVLHIGTTIGRSTADIALEQPQPQVKPALLRFAQVDPQKHNAPMLLSRISGEGVLELNYVPLDAPMPIQNGSVITVHEDRYRCEMYAWDRLPIETRVNAAWATSVGPVREHNEDAIGIYQEKGAYLFAVADGVGGGYAGDEVSEFAVKYLLTVFNRNVRLGLPWESIYSKAFEHINREVRNFVYYAPTPAGTTLTSIVIQDWNAHIAHVGDSRLYHQRGRFFDQLTIDHSKKVFIEQNTRHLNEAKEPLPTREVLVRAIGRNDDIEPDIFTVRLQPGDKFLLCSDGVTNQLSQDEIARVMATERLDRVADRLVTIANERDNTDNASAIVIDVLEESHERDAWHARPADRVYVGSYGVWTLKLNKPREMKTIYIRASQTGCLLLMILLIAAGVLWGVRQFDNDGNDTEAIQGVTITQTDTPEVTAETPNTPTPEAEIFVTSTAIPSTATSIQTSTVPPDATLAPTVTPIPPTSTIRPSNR